MSGISFPQPEIIGTYRGGESETSLIEDIQEKGIELSAQDIASLRQAVKDNIIAQLPSGFQGGRVSGRDEKLIILYTTRVSKPRRGKSLSK